MQGVHNTIGDIRCHFPHLVKKRSVEENNNNAFITGYEISVSNNNRNFSVSHMMYILDSACQDTLNVSGELRFLLKVCEIWLVWTIKCWKIYLQSSTWTISMKFSSIEFIYLLFLIFSMYYKEAFKGSVWFKL